MDKLKYVVTGAPHANSNDTVRSIMLDVVIALVPAVIMATYFFGIKALALIGIGIISSVLFEFLYQKLTKQAISISDLSAVVTGILLAFNLPVTASFWVPVVGSFFAIVIIKQLFGGIGQNFMNPALGARAFLLASYPSEMTRWVGVDGASSATPLQALQEGVVPNMTNYLDALFGNHGGCLGETCVIALLLGGLYLLYRRVISWRIPTFYIGTVALFSIIFGRAGAPFYEIITGGLMLGAFFMATDYSSSPVTNMGKIVFAVGCGLLTIIIRTFSSTYTEGVSYAILLMNLAVPLIDRFTQPKVFGEVKQNG